jgi:hypothetical protein
MVLKKTIIRALGEIEMEDKTDSYVSKPPNMCVPIYDGTALEHDDGVNAFIGTGILIGYGGRLLLVTAWHCLNNHPIIAVGGFSPPLLMSRRSRNKIITKPALDLDFIDLGRFSEFPKSNSFQCITWSSVSLTTPHVRSAYCRLFGYPAEKNLAEIAKVSLNANLTIVDVAEDINVLKHAQFSEIALQKKYYIGLRYDPRLLQPLNRKGPKIKAFNGFSGGPIWRLGEEETFNFTGIMIECHSTYPTSHGEYILYGINVLGIDLLLKERFPDLNLHSTCEQTDIRFS